MAIKTFAAIDVGSFELELGIYEISGKYGIREIDHLRHVLALGKDTYNDGKITYVLVDEMCQVLREFMEVMKTYRVQDYRAYASSALREARNSQIVLDQILVRERQLWMWDLAAPRYPCLTKIPWYQPRT